MRSEWVWECPVCGDVVIVVIEDPDVPVLVACRAGHREVIAHR